MSRLLLVRHGDTELSCTERLWGHTDGALSAAGLRQVERLRDRLATEKIDVVYSSNLRRTLATAEIIASGYQLEVITCAELREINFGQLEGLTFKEINQLYPELTKLWFNWSMTLNFPGGESLGAFRSRVSSFIGRLDKHGEGETILIVAHSGSLRLLVCQFLGIDLKHWSQIRLGLASLSIVETYPQGGILSLLNDVSYLD